MTAFDDPALERAELAYLRRLVAERAGYLGARSLTRNAIAVRAYRARRPRPGASRVARWVANQAHLRRCQLGSSKCRACGRAKLQAWRLRTGNRRKAA